MAVFFLLVELETKRELVKGQLSSFRNASLPIFAVVGGMLVPAVIYSIFNSSWTKMLGVGFLAGIGFTMSIFIALLSFKGEIEVQDEAKFAILIASFLAAVLGFIILNSSSKNNTEARP